ncbi:MAG: hypothetical protein ACYTHJ_18980 [Planctomycetota bacterium]|jgi:hypothetical protein
MRTERKQRRHRRKAISLVESSISVGIVGVMLVASLNTLGGSRMSQRANLDKRYGYYLAETLMEEILEQDYVDEVEGDGSFGRLETESATGDRSLFNDVDDYNTWSYTPPLLKDGTPLTEFVDWERSVEVVRVDNVDRSSVVSSESGLKRITVTVKRGVNTVATLTAYKTFGLPELIACCLPDDSCADLSESNCAGNGGTSNGPDSSCVMVNCVTSLKLLFVSDGACVKDESEAIVCTPTPEEQERITLIESWGYAVDLIQVAAEQSAYTTAIGSNDIVYVPGTINGNDLGNKLDGATIGIVNENTDLCDNYGIADTMLGYSGTGFMIRDDTHYITEGFSFGQTVTLANSTQTFYLLDQNLAVGLDILGEHTTDQEMLGTLDTGAIMSDNNPAPARRVQLPWGNGTTFSELTDDAKTIMLLSIEWASGTVDICGDDICDEHEMCACAVDCGAPVSFESSADECQDGLDNDCDGNTDCDDISCNLVPACVPLICGNGMCQSSEDCTSCSADCASVRTGKTAVRHCCGNGILEAAEGDGSICDGNP